MKKYAFLAKLEELLTALPEQEREDALTYYEEYLDAAGKEREAETIAALGTPEEVAGKILEGEGLAAPAPALSAAPIPPAPESGRPAPPPSGARPEPPKPGVEPPAPPADHPAPPPPPAPHPGGPTPPPPEPGKPVPPPPGAQPEPPKPGAEPPKPEAPAKGGQAWKIVAVVAAAVVALAMLAMALDYAEDRAEKRLGPVTSVSAQQGSTFNQPAQSAAAQPQAPTQAPAAEPDTAENQSGTQTVSGDTTYAVNQSDGTATVASAATELDLQVQCGDVTLLRDDTVTQLTVEIVGAGQGTFDLKRKKNELKVTDLRRATTEADRVTVTVHVPAAVREVDIDVGTGSIVLEGTLPPETSVKVSTGDVTAERIAVQELEAETGAGNITLGRVEAQGRAVSLDFESGSGDIAVSIAGSETDYQQELETGTGSITVNGAARVRGEYNEYAANELDAKTGSGSITLDFIAQ